MDSIVEPYVKYETLREKDKEKAISAAQSNAGKHQYWQPFAWSIAPLLTDDGTIPDSISFKPIYRVKENDLNDESLFSTFLESKVCIFSFFSFIYSLVTSFPLIVPSIFSHPSLFPVLLLFYSPSSLPFRPFKVSFPSFPLISINILYIIYLFTSNGILFVT